MARVSGQLKSSANAGQLSVSLLGRVNIKQYYSGAKTMRGFESITQSGFDLLPGSAYLGSAPGGACIQATLNISRSLSYTLYVSTGQVEIWRNDRVKVATVAVAALTAGLIPDLEFYGEANTVGIFHQDLPNGIRLFRNAGNDALWTVSDWPWAKLPEIDLGGVYATTDDYWSLYLRWGEAATGLVVNVSIDGETTGGVRLVDGSNAPISPDAATDTDWHGLATLLRAEIRALAGMNNDVDIQFDPAQSAARYRCFNIVFTSSLSGSEYQVDARILNTSEASILPSHIVIGKTDGEPLISAGRGGFAGMTLFQDRACYFAPKARGAAVAISRAGEYFDLDIESQSDAAARLEALRTETSETILHLLDATYLMAFTDRAEYFASNRTIKRNEPMNWVRASAHGSRKGCKPVLLEGSVYFISKDGGLLYRAEYDAVSEIFRPQTVNDLNGDIVSGIARMAVQRKTAGMVSDRLWLLRDDGRLLSGIANLGQDIPLAVCEWQVAQGGLVRGVSVDGQDQVWLTVERNGLRTREILEEASVNLFQSSISGATDLTGRVTGLAALNGRTVWALIDNDIHGPFSVVGGAIETDVAGRPVTVGIWSPPVYESMPYVRVLPNDDVVRRPGKVGSVRLYVSDTASLAIGANERGARDVPLQQMQDDLSAPKQNFTGHITVPGLIGVCMDPTLTITQVRPGRLRVRDYIAGVKL